VKFFCQFDAVRISLDEIMKILLEQLSFVAKQHKQFPLIKPIEPSGWSVSIRFLFFVKAPQVERSQAGLYYNNSLHARFNRETLTNTISQK
jgi:hypothetical protein